MDALARTRPPLPRTRARTWLLETPLLGALITAGPLRATRKLLVHWVQYHPIATSRTCIEDRQMLHQHTRERTGLILQARVQYLVVLRVNNFTTMACTTMKACHNTVLTVMEAMEVASLL